MSDSPGDFPAAPEVVIGNWVGCLLPARCLIDHKFVEIGICLAVC